MMIEKSGTIRLKDIHIPQGGTPEQQELAQGMVRVNHLYRSALKVAVTQLEILDEEFASLYDHSPIHHIEYRIKTVDSIVEKLKRRGFEVTIDKEDRLRWCVAQRLKAGGEGRRLATVAWMSNHDRARALSDQRGVIGTAVIHHDDLS